MRRSKLFGCMLAGAMVSAAASAYAGQITMYDGPDFHGRSIVALDGISNLETSPLARTTSSVVVNDGTWEACTQAFYRGRCVQLAPGSYSRLGGEFASVRQIVYDPGRVVTDSAGNPVSVASGSTPIVINPGPAAVVIKPGSGSVIIQSDPNAPTTSVVTAPAVTAPVTIAAVPPAGPIPGDTRIILYQRDARGSRAVELTSNVDDLGNRRFENQANAAYVAGGIWRLCDHEKARGFCTDFTPGRYDSLGTLDGRVSSAYIVVPEPTRVSGTAIIPSGRMVLYQYQNFGGASAVVQDGRAPDLDWAKFKDRAGSARIESGTWLVCSDLGYEGECKLLGPGDYPQLSGVIRDGVYSAREVWHPQYGVADVYRLR